MKYQELKRELDANRNELLTKSGFFAAFSQEQFEKNKTPLKEGDKYVDIGGGCFMPKSNYEAFKISNNALDEAFNSEIKNNNLEEDEILYQLENHECFYIGEIDDVVELFENRYSKEQILFVYRKNYEKYAD